MIIVKALNDGSHVISKRVYSFLTEEGWVTPKEIYIGFDNLGNELHEMSQKGITALITMNNEMFLNQESKNQLLFP